MSSIAHSSHMDIFQNLAVDLETEGRYLFLNCIANQLRLSNLHVRKFHVLYQQYDRNIMFYWHTVNTPALRSILYQIIDTKIIYHVNLLLSSGIPTAIHTISHVPFCTFLLKQIKNLFKNRLLEFYLKGSLSTDLILGVRLLL